MSVKEWFEGAGLGLFVHWDHASQQGIELSWPLVGKSILPGAQQVEDDVSIAQYQSSAASFDPKRWDPAGLARLARSCGARYVVLTTRHHAGFSMFHSKFSTFSIEHSAYGQDIVREFVEAVRAEGLRVGLYYSLSDWAHPNYPRFEETDKPYPRDAYRRASAKDWALYLEYVKGQVTELLTNYGPIDLVWFDGDWERTAEEWDAPGLRALIRSLQPSAIVNNRLPGQGDYATPEQALPSERPAGPWEMCLTMNKGWGWRPSDGDYKPARRIARYLAEVAAQGGNLLLNLSPKGDGSLPEVQVSRLKELGSWVASHGESVIGVELAAPAVQFYGPVTRRADRLYLHLVTRPTDLLTVRGVPIWRIRRVTLLGREVELAYEHNMDVQDGTEAAQDVLGEVLIDAGEPTGALHDVIAIDFDHLEVPSTLSAGA